MLFYRVEHKTKVNESIPTVNVGPYACTKLAKLLTDDMYEPEIHPTPDSDPLLRDFWETCWRKSNYVFGFASLTSLHAWFFSEVGKRLADEEGLGRIGIYQVADEHFHKGQFQAIALASELTLIETKPCVFRE